MRAQKAIRPRSKLRILNEPWVESLPALSIEIAVIGSTLGMVFPRYMKRSASVSLPAKVETLALSPNPADHHIFFSAAAPAEPHEFSAQLRLKVGDCSDVLPFKMTEPAGHHH